MHHVTWADNVWLMSGDRDELKSMAQQLTSALGVTIEYIDMTEEELTQAVVEAGMPEEDIELQILCHFRQIRNGKAELVTDTYQEIIGRSAASVHDWACANQGILE